MSEITELVALNADVVGYSRLLEDDRERVTSLMNEARRMVSESVADRAGTLVDFSGDNFTAVYPDVVKAMESIIEIATGVDELNHDSPPESHLQFRFGVDTGEVSVSEGQYFGEPLNIAARLQAMAPVGGLSISGRAYGELDEPELRFESRGPQRLKNISEAVDVYDFVDLPLDPRPGHHRGPDLGLPTIAVLPIHTSDPALGDVVRQELIHRLARNEVLRVIDVRDESDGAYDTGDARYFMESGAQQVGTSVRLYATLFDVNKMTVVKAKKVNGAADEIFDLAEELAEAIGADVEIDLVIGAPGAIYADLHDPEAISNVYRGWFHLTSATQEGWARSVDYFSKVEKSHPDLPYGGVLLSFAHWIGALYEWSNDVEASLNIAEELAERAMEHGDETGMSTMVLAAVYLSRGDSEAAAETVENAQITRPTCDTTFGLAGSVRRYLGQWDEAVGLEDKAIRLTGVDKPWYHTVKACSLLMGGHADQAMSLAEMVVTNQPGNLEALLVLAGAQAEMGLNRRAKATGERLREQFPGVDVAAWLDRNPYQDAEAVEHWKRNLTVAGIL